MTLRHFGTLALVVLVLAGCRREAPAEAPEPADDPPAATTDREAELAAERQREREREERERALADAREVLEQMVFFDYDSSSLRPEGQAVLRQKAEILRGNPDLRIRIEGHTDERGSTEYNLALGQRRAESVRAFLATQGVSTGQLATLSYGKERPRAPGSNEAAWAQNRRAEFVITAGTISNLPRGTR